MDIGDHLNIGESREEIFQVEGEHTAYHIGSGDERVLATPWMISFMERVSNRLLSDYLQDGTMSVGIHVDVKHLAATPVNVQIRVRVEVVEVIKNQVVLKVEAWDAFEKIGEGTHKRAVVDIARFLKRVLGKSGS